ncbi:MAG: acetylxylan esterase [Bacteroidales bacterium]|jgi:cephalosporin-C deacetylase-like acetyl esterase|nr:acetylxylan esterase [Bacteroidales bacterium]
MELKGRRSDSLIKTATLIALLSTCPWFQSAIAGQGLRLLQNHPDGIYSEGDEARVMLAWDGEGSDSARVRLLRDFKAAGEWIIIRNEEDTVILFSEVVSGPASYILEVYNREGETATGLVADPGSFIPGTSRPSDLSRFWKRQKRKLRAMPLVPSETRIKVGDPGYECFDVELSCPGPRPARGYLARPVHAMKGSLPIVIYLHAAGVYGDWCRSRPEIALRYASAGNGALAFDLNAHGMLNGQPDEYYRDLEDNELKNYALKGLEKREEVYFLGMYLRLLRTIDYLTGMPEWDGKRILLIGESQGGGQALAAAGLDPRVSAVVATVPAMCDWGAFLRGSRSSWPYPFETGYDREKMMSALPYFDVAHLLRGSRATIVAEIGLIDMTCPAPTVFAALNQAIGEKIIYTLPYRGHHMTQPDRNEQWRKEVIIPIEEFISDYLK